MSIEAMSLDPCVVGAFRGHADESALRTLVEASEVLVNAPQARLVLDLQGLQGATPWCAGTVARLIREAHRVGKDVHLVRCGQWFYSQLAANGLGGPVNHSGSLTAATDGLLGDSRSSLSLSLRSLPENLRRVRSVLDVLAQRLAIAEDELQQVKTAVGEACTNAITHGSPQGPRDTILVAFHLNRDALIVDVADQGPGFDPEGVALPQVDEMPEHGFGIYLMRQLMDELEYFRDTRGTVVRLTKYVGAPTPRAAYTAA